MCHRERRAHRRLLISQAVLVWMFALPRRLPLFEFQRLVVGSVPNLRPPLFALAAVLASDQIKLHCGLSAALPKEAALVGVGLKDHVEPGRLASSPFLLQCFRLRHFQLLLSRSP